MWIVILTPPPRVILNAAQRSEGSGLRMGRAARNGQFAAQILRRRSG